MLTKTAIIYDPECLKHDSGPNHPESANRLRVIVEELNQSGFFSTDECSLLGAEASSVEELELVHELDYIKLVEQYCKLGGGQLDSGDTVVSPESFLSSLFAVGGTIRAVDLVMKGEAENAFAVIRPPGHHAGSDYALGFCVFNNIAIATTHLINRFNLDRVLILDIDAHHGNGTQEIFYNSSKVLYVSLHQDPTDFPGNGFLDEIGEGEGLGYNVNIPFPLNVDDRIYLKAFTQIVTPITMQYKPDFIFVSAGFDGHHSDPVAELSLSAFGYLNAIKEVLDLSSRLCGGKFAAVLEGGYDLDFLGKMTCAIIAKMAGIPYKIRDKPPKAPLNVYKRAKKILKKVKNVQASFWKL
jgi:acetoin utilization deacetylase AcuC-like enzyme